MTVADDVRSMFFTTPLQLIVVEPALSALTLPLLSTDATLASVDVHANMFTLRVSIGRCFASTALSAN